jgi:hypothetical protein
MILENPDVKFSPTQKKRFVEKGVIIDSCVLIVLFVGMYHRNHPQKNYLLRACNITESQMNCLNTIVTNFRLRRFIVTPYILSEFLNKIRSNLKQDYKDIKKEFFEELKAIGEICTKKEVILEHKDFFEFGNDISLVLAIEEQLKKSKYSCVISFDGRFIERFYRKTNGNILAFNLDTLQYYF